MQIDLDQLRVRPMRDDEYPAFLERSVREYTEEVAANLGIAETAAREKATKTFGELVPDGLASEGQHIFIIETGDGETIGELWFGIEDKPEGRVAFGYDFWVRPELRDRGVGRRAMQLGAELARERGADRLALNVFGDNDRAIHLYRSFGFEVSNTYMTMPLR